MEILRGAGQSDMIYSARKLLSGNLVAFPTETVYGIGADALNESAVDKIYRVKGRPSNHPLIIHLPSIEYLNLWTVNVPSYVIDLAHFFWPGPLTFVLQRSKLAKNFVTGGQDFVAIRVPNQPIAISLLTEFGLLGGLGIAAPSANRFGKVSPTSADSVVNDLGNYLESEDLLIDGGNCKIGIESTIIKCSSSFATILRPGAITKNQLRKVANIFVSDDISTNLIATPGLIHNHYAPKAKVVLNQIPQQGDGLIALYNIETPKGVIRLASPKNNNEYGYILYDSFRKADNLGLQNIVAITPSNSGLGIAINDRLKRAANSDEFFED